MTIIEEIMAAVVIGDAGKTLACVEEAFAKGHSVDQVLNEGLIAGSKIVGEKFDDGDYYLPDLIRSGDAVKSAMQVVRPKLLESAGAGSSKQQRVLIGTVETDIHDIGKNIVGTTLLAAGYEVFDIGVNVSAQKFLDEALSRNIQVLALSSLMTTTRPYLKDAVEKIKNSAQAAHLKVIVGGGSVTGDYAATIGADGYAANAVECVRLLDDLFREDA